ncbi:MAG TPA: PEGA domain-containing protein [Vicinamibacterales bacterium]|nr:PEGA domain-containing protein [Vicinamibacterales bacterium]
MRRSSLVKTLIFAGALAMSAGPALAQRGGGGHGGGGGHVGGGGGGGARVGGGPSGGGMRMGGGGGGMRMGGGMRGTGGVAMPRGGGTVRGPYVGSGFYRGGGNYYRGGYGGYYRGGYGGYGARYYGGYGRYWGGRYYNYAPIHYYRPYYTFHPYFNLGFGLWAGYSIPWAYPYYYPYAYPYPYPYSAAVPGYSVAPSTVYPDTTVEPNTSSGQPDQSNLGGLSFEITPSTAQVFVDGNYVGTVGQFTPTSQPLGVPSGHHRIEVRQTGYRTMTFEVDVVAGQVIPYQGQMEQ